MLVTEMKELKRFKSSTFDTIARRRFVEDQDIILELTGKIHELQNEINCMNDSRDYQDAESIRSGHSHVCIPPVSFTPHPILGGMLRRTVGMPSRREGPPSMTRVQHRLRFTMQHVYGLSGILGNQCADHAGALGTLGFTSSHNVTTVF